MAGDAAVTVGAVSADELPIARRIVAAAFAQEPFALGMFGESPIVRFAGMSHHYAAWPDTPGAVALGARSEDQLVGVAAFTVPGRCGVCDVPTSSFARGDSVADRIEYEFQLACRQSHTVTGLAPHARIETVATEPSLRGSGVGRVLMEALLDGLRARGVELAVLECLTTRAGFYEHSGFRPLDEFDDPSGPGLRMVLMAAAIGGS